MLEYLSKARVPGGSANVKGRYFRAVLFPGGRRFRLDKLALWTDDEYIKGTKQRISDDTTKRFVAMRLGPKDVKQEGDFELEYQVVFICEDGTEWGWHSDFEGEGEMDPKETSCNLEAIEGPLTMTQRIAKYKLRDWVM